MRISVRAERFDLTPQLRSVVASRLVSTLDPFGAHIASVDIRNRIAQQQREWIERPENYLRPVVREYWRPPGVEPDQAPPDLAPPWRRYDDSFERPPPHPSTILDSRIVGKA